MPETSSEIDRGFSHLTVMPEEAVDALAPRAGGVYCDGTLGGGGHAERVLARAEPDGRLLGVDRDPEALLAAAKRLSRFGDRVILAHGSFGDLPTLLRTHADRLGTAKLDGVLVDLGVSSPQLDHADRGFSFRREGPIDMRMDPTRGETARELCQRLSFDELADLIRAYGEERFAGRVARAIQERLADGELTSTTELAALIASVIPTREPGKDPATRTFQALRIAVNDELGEVERLMNAAPEILATGGRLAVISFHSLEDGIVKHRFREMAKESNFPPDIAAQMGLPLPTMRILTRKPIEPSEVEVAQNARARSAKLRVAERR